MSLNRKNLLNISKFTQKAKKCIGTVKSTEILNNKSYANDVLINAVLSGDDELVELSKLMFKEVNVDVNLICSVESYINNLLAKGASSEHLHKSKYFIVKLTKHLIGIDVSGASYRNAVDQLLKLIDLKDRTYCIQFAREFYPIWRNAYKLINEDTIKTENTKLQELIELWDRIETETFTDFEEWPLNVYINSMRQIKVPEKEIKIRSRIAKLITIKLRAVRKDIKKDYRNAVNELEPLFSNENMKEFYHVVSREYFRFWLGEFPKIPIV